MYDQRVRMEDLIAYAWSAPIRDLATDLDISDVALSKLLRRHGVENPPQGYWNKVRAGHRVPKMPEAPPRKPGQNNYVTIDRRIPSLPNAPIPSPDGPFQSAAVPENLEDLRSLERAKIGKGVSARSMGAPHPDIETLLERDQKLRERQAAHPFGFMVEPPLAESPYEKRRLRIINAIFRTLEKRGHSGRLYRDERCIEVAVLIGDTGMSLDLNEVGRRPPSRWDRERPNNKRPAAVRLELSVCRFGGKPVDIWRDKADQTIEEHIGEICADIIVAGEAAYRVDLREQAERVEKERLQALKQAEAARQIAEKAREDSLLLSGQLLAQAEDLRSVIARVEAAVVAGSVDVSPEALQRWRSWALARADAIDPIKSGQVFDHLGR